MRHSYGTFTSSQMEAERENLHDRIHWLLIYKDPKTARRFDHVDFELYFRFLMKRISGLSSLLGAPRNTVSLMSLLEAARLETQTEPFDYAAYRKLILDAQSAVDLLWEESK